LQLDQAFVHLLDADLSLVLLRHVWLWCDQLMQDVVLHEELGMLLDLSALSLLLHKINLGIHDRLGS